MQVVEPQAAPGSAQHTQPPHPVVRVQQRPCQRKRVQDFRPGGELFEFERAEREVRLAKRSRDGGQGPFGAGENGDAVLLAGHPGLLHLRDVALHQLDDLPRLGFAGGVLFNEVIDFRSFVPTSLRLKVQV